MKVLPPKKLAGPDLMGHLHSKRKHLTIVCMKSAAPIPNVICELICLFQNTGPFPLLFQYPDCNHNGLQDFCVEWLDRYYILLSLRLSILQLIMTSAPISLADLSLPSTMSAA